MILYLFKSSVWILFSSLIRSFESIFVSYHNASSVSCGGYQTKSFTNLETDNTIAQIMGWQMAYGNAILPTKYL